MLHKNIIPADMHGIVAFNAANLAAITALSVTSQDLGKIAKALDTGALYVLNTVSPDEWVVVGATAPTEISLNFNYGDSTPAVLFTAAANKVIYDISLYITIPFNGTNASLTVGDSADTDRLMESTENAVTIVGGNTTTPAYKYSTDTVVNLYITPGAGATTGSGTLTFKIQS